MVNLKFKSYDLLTVYLYSLYMFILCEVIVFTTLGCNDKMWLEDFL